METKQIRAISWSEWYVFYMKGEEAYYKQYIEGIREPPNQKMILGSVIHKMIEDPKYHWKQALNNAYFTSDIVRAVSKIEIPNVDINELDLTIEGELPCRAIIDGVDIDLDDDIVMGYEWKTSSSYWTQEKSDEHKQITHYCYCLWKKYKRLIPFRLLSINTKNGKHRSFYTPRTMEQIMAWEQNLIAFRDDLINRGWWDKKISSNPKK